LPIVWGGELDFLSSKGEEKKNKITHDYIIDSTTQKRRWNQVLLVRKRIEVEGLKRGGVSNQFQMRGGKHCNYKRERGRGKQTPKCWKKKQVEECFTYKEKKEEERNISPPSVEGGLFIGHVKGGVTCEIHFSREETICNQKGGRNWGIYFHS